MATPTAVCNIALRRIGAKALGQLDTDTGKESRVAREIYDEARQDCLSLHHWNFAVKRASLTASSTSPTFGWDYAYPLPDDFIRLISVHPIDDDDSTIEYRLEYQESDDRVLLTNSTTVYIRYVFDHQDVNAMSHAFRDLLAFRLARDFASALAKTVSAAEFSDIAFRRKLARAKAIDGIEDYPEQMAEGSWVTERHPEDGWD